MSVQTETPIPATEPAKAGPHLFIATPCYGAMQYLVFALSLHKCVEAAKREGVGVTLWQQGGESLIPRARNYAVYEFLQRSECTHLMFIDADIEFDPEDVGKLLSADVDVVAGSYPLKRIDVGRVKAALERNEKDPLARASKMVVHGIDAEERDFAEGFGDCIEVKECGTGFMLIKREALLRFIERYRDEIAYDSDDEPDRTIHQVFQAAILPDWRKGKRVRRYLSEDYWFCRKWREMGGKVFLHLGVNLGHMGMHLHRGNAREVIGGGPARGLKAKPEDRDRIMKVLGGSIATPSSTPSLIIDRNAKEGVFAVWASQKYPNAFFDVYEPDLEYRSMLLENFETYGIKGAVRHDPTRIATSRPYWLVDGEKVIEVP